MQTADYLSFLRNHLPTGSGVTYQQIHQYTARQLEQDHQYIQWLFPLMEASAYNSNAPQIDIIDLHRAIADDPKIVEQQIASCELMLNHWGIVVMGSIRSSYLLHVNNPAKLLYLNGHNALRFSRMLQSLVYHGLTHSAQSILDFVLTHCQAPWGHGHLRPTTTPHDPSLTLWEFYLEKSLNEIGPTPMPIDT